MDLVGFFFVVYVLIIREYEFMKEVAWEELFQGGKDRKWYIVPTYEIPKGG